MENTQTESNSTTATTEPAMSSSELLASFNEQYRIARDARRERLSQNRKRIQKALKRNAVTSVVVSYSGSGDSGQIDTVSPK